MSPTALVVLTLGVVVLPVGFMLWLARRSATGAMDAAAERNTAWVAAHPRLAAALPGGISAAGHITIAVLWAWRGEPVMAGVFVVFAVVGGVTMSWPLWRRLRQERETSDGAR